jgi:phosphoglycerate dehydrogenase-like enzyme
VSDRTVVVPRSHAGAPRILVAPRAPRESMRAAIEAGGGVLVDDPAVAEGMVWLSPRDPVRLERALEHGPGIVWVQLPFAGIEPYHGHLDPGRVWTSGKGVYAEPVAEMALAMLLALLRDLTGYARARTWSPPVGRNLLGAHVVILGGGEITRSLVTLLAPFRCRITVLRRLAEPFPGATRTGTLADLGAVARDADALVVALALTPETRHVVDARLLDALPEHAMLVNVGRGGHVDTDALVAALAAGSIGGAALDVTDPEPLPDGHPLWAEPRCLITPHIGNTPEMGVPLLEARVRDNVARFADGRPLIGHVDVAAGY